MEHITFNTARERQEYHRKLKESKERHIREANDHARRLRNGRDRSGEVIVPERLSPEEKEAVRRERRKGMASVSTFIRSTHGRVGERNPGA